MGGFNIRQITGLKPHESVFPSLQDAQGDLGEKIFYKHKRLGGQIYQLIQLRYGSAPSAGALVARKATVAVTAASGTVRSITQTAALADGDAVAITANELAGDTITILDDAGAAGAAPEGQTRIIGSNTTKTIVVTENVDDAFTAAVAASDTAIVNRFFKADAAADGELASNVLGVLPNTTLVDTYYAWVLREGRCDWAQCKAGCTAGNPIVADAAIVGDVGSDEVKLQIGFCWATAFAGEAGQGGLIEMMLESGRYREEA